MANDLAPTDGISDVWVELDGMDIARENAPWTIRFRFFRGARDKKEIVGSIHFDVQGYGRPFEATMAEAHEKLISALRQSAAFASNARKAYSGEAP